MEGVYDWNGVGTKCPREKTPLFIFAIYGKINVSGLDRSVTTVVWWTCGVGEKTKNRPLGEGVGGVVRGNSHPLQLKCCVVTRWLKQLSPKVNKNSSPYANK